jgi:hypothetical protein
MTAEGRDHEVRLCPLGNVGEKRAPKHFTLVHDMMIEMKNA